MMHEGIDPTLSALTPDLEARSKQRLQLWKSYHPRDMVVRYIDKGQRTDLDRRAEKW